MIQQVDNLYNNREEFIASAATLLSQQVWCWGRDICRHEGNLLLQIGFQRIEPPADFRAVDSVYSLELPNGRYLVLRGYGIFYGDDKYGGIFLPRYEFLPGYTNSSFLETPPWKESDLPELKFPSHQEWDKYITLLIDVINWIKSYEQSIVDNHGLEYRRSSLAEWDNGKRTIIPPEQIVSEWHKISSAISEGILY